MDDLTRKIQDLVDRYCATGPADIPEPDRDEIVAEALRRDAIHQPWQTMADILEDATETSLLLITAQLEHAIKHYPNGAEAERKIGQAVQTLARQRYSGWLHERVTEAATTSRARQGRQMAELEADARIHARKEG
jgi:hypothetical protein